MSDNFATEEARRAEAQKAEQERQALQAQADPARQQKNHRDITNKDGQKLESTASGGTTTQVRRDVTNDKHKQTDNTIKMKEIKVEGRRTDQIDNNIKEQTGRSAYEAAKKLGIDTNNLKNPNWTGQVEDKLISLGIMRPQWEAKKENAGVFDSYRMDKAITAFIDLAKSNQPTNDTARSVLCVVASWVSDYPSKKDGGINSNVFDKLLSNLGYSNLSKEVKVKFTEAIGEYIPKGDTVIADERGTGTRQVLADRDQEERIKNFLSIGTGTGHFFAGLSAALGNDTSRIKAAGQLGDIMEAAAMLGAAAAWNRPMNTDSSRNNSPSLIQRPQQQTEPSNKLNREKEPNKDNPNQPKASPTATVKTELPVPNQNENKNQGPYSARAQREGYEKSEDKGTLTSTTIPPDNHPSLRRKAIDLSDGRSIGYDGRGLPDLSPFAVAIIRVVPGKDYKPDSTNPEKDLRTEMKLATKKLGDLIGQGKSFNSTVFTDDQMAAIRAGKEKIPEFTWHHTLGSELQLVPSGIHEKAKPHLGSRTMREGR